jgi:D-3-phosphoglycerate dehydrogenase / 2-oxoglutarate reductase
MNILITAPFDADHIKILEKSHRVFNESWESTMFFGKGQQLIDRLNKDDINILVTEVDKVDKEVLQACPNLKLICDCRGNPTNVDIQTASERNVVVTFTPGRNAVAVAELCLGLILSLLRFIPRGQKLIYEGKVDESTYFKLQGTEVTGKTIGLVGFGAVAKELARRLQGFDVRILAYDPYVSDDIAKSFNTTMVDLDTLLKTSDIVSNHLPVTNETTKMLDFQKLSLMKPTAFFINTGRAVTVDEEALIQMLKDKKIAGGAFDVFGTEPLPQDSKYLQLDNVVLTPHIAGATKEIATHQAKMVCSDIEAFLRQEKPPRICNPSVMP